MSVGEISQISSDPGTVEVNCVPQKSLEEKQFRRDVSEFHLVVFVPGRSL